MDDQEYVRNFTKAALKRLGHEVLLAKDDREAVSLRSNRSATATRSMPRSWT
jgi:hypothetical protein